MCVFIAYFVCYMDIVSDRMVTLTFEMMHAAEQCKQQ